MKTARTLAQELIGYIGPPRGTAIVVNEAPSMRPEDPELDYSSRHNGPNAGPTSR